MANQVRVLFELFYKASFNIPVYDLFKAKHVSGNDQANVMLTM